MGQARQTRPYLRLFLLDLNHFYGKFIYYKTYFRKGRRIGMEKHKFWAWATVFCFLMTMYTGYKRK